MSDILESKWLRKYFKVLLVPGVFVFYYFLVYLVNPYTDYWKFENRRPYDVAIELGGIMTFCYLMVESCLFISRRLNTIIPWEERPFQRSVVQLSTQLLLTLTMHYCVGFLIVQVFFHDVIESRPTMTLMQQLDRWRYLIVSIAITVLLNSAVTARYFLRRWRDSMLEAAQLKLHAAELKEIAMQAELQSLKLQLDPHFMFNNFSTLSELISEDRDLAQAFIENLSKVYRYMILNIHYNTISLQKELKFIQSYIYLISIRHGSNVVIDIDVADILLERQLPPITLQLLIENAIKHNIASESQPLRISITVDDQQRLVVVNNLQRIAGGSMHSSQLGLKNIRERYRLVSGQLPEIQQSADAFRVLLPLLD
jgi:two-component system, LytTR family, sensor kinase